MKPNVITYNTLMNAYGTNHTKAEEGVETHEESRSETRRYNVHHSDERVRYEPTEAEEVLIRMKKAGVTPDVTTYNTLMNAYGTNSTKRRRC